jgi:hypothetical protein
MAIVFEPSKYFDKVQGFYRNLAQRMLIGKKFGSLEDALNQTILVRGKDVPISEYFKVDGKTIFPEKLPMTIREAEISGVYVDDEGVSMHNMPGVNLHIMTAKYVD